MVALLTLLTLLVAVLSLALDTAYFSHPKEELRKRARKGDNNAHIIYEVARHGSLGRTTLRIIGLSSLALGVVLIVDQLDTLLAFGATLFLFTLALYLRGRSIIFSQRMAVVIGPYLASFLIKLRPLTRPFARSVQRVFASPITSTVYDMEDLIQLIDQQKVATNNRIEKNELDMAIHVLRFGSKLVRDHMVPRRVVHFVRSEEPVGPILLTELHDSGFSRFPVRNEDEEIVGTLYLKDLVEKRVSGIVSNVMSPDVFYVDETEPLERVLAKFLRTKHHLFIVQNQFHEIVGIITIEDVLEQAMGRRIVDEDDVHEDMREYAQQEPSS